jgi:hypothetical protein
VAKDLGVRFADPVGPTNLALVESNQRIQRAIGEIISIPIVTWLTRPSTANRNMISQALTFAPKVIRDFYMGALRTAYTGGRRGTGFLESHGLAPEGAQAKFFADDIWSRQMPFQEFISDFRAFRTLGPRARAELLPELLGSTFLQEHEQAVGGAVTAGLGRILRLTGFNFWDVASKRLVVESTLDALARSSYWRAKRMGAIPKGMSKKEFINRQRAGIPRAWEATAYREMDTWGAFDYSNTAEWVEKMKRSALGRGMVAYPTWYYKMLANFYSEMFSPRNQLDAFLPNQIRAGLGKNLPGRMNLTAEHLLTPITAEKRLQAVANQLTAATIYGTAWGMIDDQGRLTEEIRNPMVKEMAQRAEQMAGRDVRAKDLPFAVQRFGRVKTHGWYNEAAGLAEDEAGWVRFYDFPVIGEVMAAKGIWGGKISVGEYMNDRVTFGPLFNIVSTLSGLSDEYNEHIPLPSRAGLVISGALPLTNEMQVLQKLADPVKREAGREGQSAWENFLQAVGANSPIANTLAEDLSGRWRPLPTVPVLSELQKPRLTRRELRIPMYNRWQSFLGYAALNTRTISQTEREARIAIAALENLQDTRDQINRDRIRDLVMKVMDENGRTVAGEAATKARIDDPETVLNTEKVIMQLVMHRAWVDGGTKSAYEAATKELKAYRDKGGHAPGRVADTVKSMIRLFDAIEHQGLVGVVRQRMPRTQRRVFEQELREQQR